MVLVNNVRKQVLIIQGCALPTLYSLIHRQPDPAY